MCGGGLVEAGDDVGGLGHHPGVSGQENRATSLLQRPWTLTVVTTSRANPIASTSTSRCARCRRTPVRVGVGSPRQPTPAAAYGGN